MRKRRKTKKRSKHYAVIAFYEKNNRWPLPSSKNEKERRLGEWITRYKFIRNHSPEKLTEKQIELIDRITADKLKNNTERWLNNYNKLKDFIEKEKGWPTNKSSDPEEIKLANWCMSQKVMRRTTPKTKINKERVRLLDAIGFAWQSYHKRRSWKESFKLVKEFYNTNGRWPVHSKDPDESRLAKWCSKMRAYKNRTDTSVTLTPRQIKNLTNLGFKWVEQDTTRRTGKKWIERYQEFCNFIKNEQRYPQSKTGNFNEESLYSWWMRMAYLKRRGKLSSDRVELLNCIGFRWGRELEK